VFLVLTFARRRLFGVAGLDGRKLKILSFMTLDRK
jgi:hypothetical protein